MKIALITFILSLLLTSDCLAQSQVPARPFEETETKQTGIKQTITQLIRDPKQERKHEPKAGRRAPKDLQEHSEHSTVEADIDPVDDQDDPETEFQVLVSKSTGKR